MGNIDWPPLYLFGFAALKSKYERAEQEIDIYKLYILTRKDFDKKILHFQLFGNNEDATEFANIELQHILSTLKKLDSYKSEERELLLEYRDYINDKGKLNAVREDFPQIFKSERAYKFFIKTIIEFNAVDEELNYIRGGQKVFNAIRDVKLYRDNILSEPFSVGKYFTEIGRIVGEEFNKSKMSEYKPKLLSQIKDYYKTNNPFD